MSQLLHGIAASSGIAIAPAFLLVGSDLSIKHKHSDDENHEVARLHDSFALTHQELTSISQHAHQSLGERAAAVVDAQLKMLDDHPLQQEIEDRITNEHETAEYALQQVARSQMNLLSRVNDNDYLNSRSTALQDVYKRMMAHLLKVKLPTPADLNHRAIFVAKNITPTDMAQFDRRFVAGLVTNEGGRTSHFTIMSKTLSLPAVVGTGNATDQIKDGDLVIVDGIHGKVIVRPTDGEVDHYQRMAGEFAREQAAWGALRNEQTVSTDGRHFQVVANVGTTADMTDYQQSGAEGIGLVRSEFLYVSQDKLPSEEEQLQAYKKFLTGVHEQRVVVRTMDIGGDKQIGGLDLPHEENPYLGFRAIRIGLARPETLRPQLRALLRASVYGRLAIMFPMIATVEEFKRAREILDEEKRKLREQNVPVADNIEVGIMLEIPSAAAMADVFARDVDFFSIGSNDLIQYLFAADRGNRNVSYLYQELHPAVLRTVKKVIDAAHAEGKWVSMCGEMASNPLATPLLMGMGLDEFSMNSSSILHIRSLINRLNTRQLQPLIHKALRASGAQEVQQLVKRYVPKVD